MIRLFRNEYDESLRGENGEVMGVYLIVYNITDKENVEHHQRYFLQQQEQCPSGSLSQSQFGQVQNVRQTASKLVQIIRTCQKVRL